MVKMEQVKDETVNHLSRDDIYDLLPEDGESEFNRDELWFDEVWSVSIMFRFNIKGFFFLWGIKLNCFITFIPVSWSYKKGIMEVIILCVGEFIKN